MQQRNSLSFDFGTERPGGDSAAKTVLPMSGPLYYSIQKPIRYTLLSVVVVLAAATTQDVHGAQDMHEAQQQLDRFLGKWEISTTMHRAVWTPVTTQDESTYTCRRILGDEFVQQKSDEYLKLYTYDPDQGCYRYWFFATGGIAVDARGQWNEEEKSFHWTCVAGPGLTTTVTHRFIDDDTIDLTIIIKDRSGRVYFHSDSRSRRVERVARRQ